MNSVPDRGDITAWELSLDGMPIMTLGTATRIKIHAAFAFG
jgi:hypothetical protein